MSKEIIEKPVSEKAYQSLVRTLASKCIRNTVVVGDINQYLQEEFTKFKINVIPATIAEIADTKDLIFSRILKFQPDTIILMGLLEYVPEKERETILKAAMPLIGAKGRLVVCVPNEDDLSALHPIRYFDRRSLKNLLKPYGFPKLLKDQPLKWLVMYVDKTHRFGRSDKERYKVIADLCRGSVIELGCGPGHLCQTIASRGLVVMGLDISDRKIAMAKENYPEIPFVDMDILALENEEARYDTVVMAEVIEHVPEEIGNRMLEIAWSLVAEGGRMVISVPNENCIPHANHLRVFDKKSLKKLLSAFGQPTVVTDQPYKWLLMHVERLSSNPSSTKKKTAKERLKA